MIVTSSILLDVTILVGISFYFLYKYMAIKHSYWEKRGVHTPKTLPIIGNFLQPLLLKLNIDGWLKFYYEQIDKPYFGLYAFDEPYFVPKDPKIIKSILVQDFEYFIDRNIAAPDHSPLNKNMMFLQKNPAWKNDRSKLSVLFSTVKLKAMFPLIRKSDEDLAEFLKNNYTVMESKEFVCRYTTDVIARCAFGIEAHCFDKLPSTFMVYGKKVFDFNLKNAISQSIYFLKPKWVNIFKLEFIPKESMDYFASAFLQAMKSKTAAGHVNDMIDILNDLKKNNLLSSSSDDLPCAMAVQILIGGFETSSTAGSFTLYELAKNLEIQDKVREEIRSVIKQHGDLTYDAISDMKYLDMCVAESLRMYPPLPFVERKCNKDYKVPNYDVVIGKGCVVMVPMSALHMDEKYFPEPHKFDPERFINNIDNSNGIYYFPFGSGPHNCIGSRFGKLSTKMVLISILLNSEVTFCKDTPDPMEFTSKSFLLQAKKGIPLMFNPLTK